MKMMIMIMLVLMMVMLMPMRMVVMMMMTKDSLHWKKERKKAPPAICTSITNLLTSNCVIIRAALEPPPASALSA